MLIRRAVFESIGLLDDDYFYGFEDLAFCLKARRAGFKAVIAGEATAYHEGGRSIGADSPRRLYFAARNHLLMAQRAGKSAPPFMAGYRTLSILALNLAHACVSRGGSLPVRLHAVLRGTRDYALGRLGDDGSPSSPQEASTLSLARGAARKFWNAVRERRLPASPRAWINDLALHWREGRGRSDRLVPVSGSMNQTLLDESYRRWLSSRSATSVHAVREPASLNRLRFR